jgi:hypothetical protein
MKLITKAINDKLLANGATPGDCPPVMKLFSPVGAATWLISERDPENPDILFGLADLGFGCPELGSISLAEIESIRLPFGLKIERDLHFNAEGRNLSVFADEARARGSIMA